MGKSLAGEALRNYCDLQHGVRVLAEEAPEEVAKPAVMKTAATPLLLWCAGLVHLRGALWEVIARQSTGGQRRARLAVDSAAVVQVLNEITTTKPGVFCTLNRSKLEVLFVQLCGKAAAHQSHPLSDKKLQPLTTLDSQPLTEQRRHLLSVAFSPAAEPRKRVKSCLCMLVIGCGFNLLPDILLGACSLVSTSPHGGLHLRHEAIKVFNTWSSRIAKVPSRRGGLRDDLAGVFRPFSHLCRPEVDLQASTPTPLLDILMHFASFFQTLLSCDPPGEGAVERGDFVEACPTTDVVLTLAKIVMQLSEELERGYAFEDRAAGGEELVQLAYVLFTFLSLLARNLAEMLGEKISDVPPAELSVLVHTASAPALKPTPAEVKLLSANTSGVSLSGGTCSFHDAICKVSVFATATMKKLKNGVPGVPDEVVIALLQQIALVKSITAMVGCRGAESAGVLHNGLHAVIINPSPDRYDTAEELLLLHYISSDRQIMSQVLETIMPCNSKPSGVHQLIYSCVTALCKPQVQFKEDTTLMSHLSCRVDDVLELCMDVLKGWVAKVLPLCEAEADATPTDALPLHESALDTLLSFVLKQLQTTRTTRLLTLLSIIKGAYVTLLTPSSALGDIAGFILKKAGSTSRSRLMLASHATSSIDAMLSMFQGEQLPDLPCDLQTTYHDWSPLLSCNTTAQWTSEDGLPTLQATMTSHSPDASALVLCITLPQGVSSVKIHDAKDRVSTAQEPIGGTKRVLFVVSGREAHVSIQVPSIAVNTTEIGIKWVSLPKTIDPLTESMLFGCWLSGAAASTALVLSRTGCCEEELPGAVHLKSPLFLYGLESDVASERTSSMGRSDDIGVFDSPVQATARTVTNNVMSEDPHIQAFYTKLLQGTSQEVLKLHNQLKGMVPASCSELMSKAVRATVAALFKHSDQKLTRAAIDMCEGRQVFGDDEACVRRLWGMGSRVALYLTERKQAWQMTDVDSLCEMVIRRAKLLLACKYYRDVRGTSSKRSSLFEHVPDDTPVTPDQVTLRVSAHSADNSHSEGLVIQFLTPPVPLPEQPLGLDDSYHSATLPYIVEQAMKKANDQIVEIVSAISIRNHRVPHCIAALRFGCLILRHIQSSKGLWGRLRGVFLNTLALGCMGLAQRNDTGAHPLALLEGVGHADVALLQSSYNQVCTSAMLDLEDLLKSPDGSIPIAILSWVSKEVRPGDVECLTQLDLVGTLVRHITITKDATLLGLIVSTLKGILVRLVGMLGTWEEWEPYCHERSETVRHNIVQIVQTATKLLYENVAQSEGVGCTLQYTLELLIILETSAEAREVADDANIGDRLLDPLSQQVSNPQCNGITKLVIEFLSQRFMSTDKDSVDEVSVAKLVGHLFRLLGRAEAMAYLQQNRCTKIHVIVSTLVSAFVPENEVVSSVVGKKVWDVMLDVATAFKKLLTVLGDDTEQCRGEVMQLVEEPLSALMLIAGQDFIYQQGDEVEVWLGDPTHVDCCGAEHVMSTGRTPHGAVNKWTAATVVGVSALSGVVTCTLDSDSAQVAQVVDFDYDVVRHRFDGFILAQTMGSVTGSHIEALHAVAEMYAAGLEGVLQMKCEDPLTCLAVHFAAKCLKALERIVAVRMVPDQLVPGVVKALSSIAARSSGLKAATWSSPFVEVTKLKTCTVAACGSTPVEQPGYMCRTCSTEKKTAFVCSYCAGVCHSSHDVTELDLLHAFACDCSTGNSKLCCPTMASAPDVPSKLHALSTARLLTYQLLNLIASARELKLMEKDEVFDQPDHSFRCLKKFMRLGHGETESIAAIHTHKGNVLRAYKDLRSDTVDPPDIGVYYGVDERLFKVAMKKFKGDLEKCVLWCKEERGTPFPEFVYDWGRVVEGELGASVDVLRYLEVVNFLQVAVFAGDDTFLRHKSLSSPPDRGTVVLVAQNASHPVWGISTGNGDGLLAHVLLILSEGVITVPIALASITIPSLSVSANEPRHASDLHGCLYRSLKDVATHQARNALSIMISNPTPTVLAAHADAPQLVNAIYRCFNTSSWAASHYPLPSPLSSEHVLCLEGLSRHRIGDDNTTLLELIVEQSIQVLKNSAHAANGRKYPTGDQLTEISCSCMGHETLEITGSVANWEAASSLILFKSASEMTDHTTVGFYRDAGMSKVLWKGGKVPEKRVLILPAGTFWYKISQVKPPEKPVNVTLHVLPHYQELGDGLATSRPGTVLSLEAIYNALSSIPEVMKKYLTRVWDACMGVVRTPYSPHKARALEVMTRVVEPIYSMGPGGKRDGVLTDMLYLRVQSEFLMTTYNPSQRSAGYYWLVELLSLMRKFVKHDICSSYCLPSEMLIAWVDTHGRGMCPSCAVAELMKSNESVSYKPMGKIRCRINSSQRYEWLDANTTQHLNDGTQPAEEESQLGKMLGTKYDGCMLIPFIGKWRPSPVDYYETCLWLDKIAIARRCAEYISGVSPILPNWLVHEVAVETVKQVRVEETNHCYDIVHDCGCLEIPNALMLYVVIDKQSVTHDSERLLLSTTAIGGDDVGSFGGRTMGGTSLLVQGCKLYFQFQTCLEYSSHNVACSHCTTLITGIRYYCSVCSVSLCCQCVEQSGVHYPQHIFMRLLRPVVKPIRPLPVLYPIAYCKNTDAFMAQQHQVACNSCGVFPMLRTRYWCMNCHNYNLCEDCIEKDQKIHDRAHVFLRVKHPLPEKLPRNSLPHESVYDKNDEYWGWFLTVSSPNTPTTDEKLRLLHGNIHKSFEIWPRVRDAELVNYVQQEYYKEWNTVEGHTLASLVSPTQGYGTLQGVGHAAIRFRFVLLRVLNKKLEGVLDHVDCSLASSDDVETLAECVRRCRYVMFSVMKAKQWERQIAESTGYERQTVTVKLRRMQIRSIQEKESFFEHTKNSLSALSGTLLRTAAPPWRVNFVGEASDDYGGPFRDLLTDICDDITTRSRPLLLPVPNGVSQIGSNREMCLPDTELVSHQSKNDFRFLGRVMGVAIRSKTVLPLDLPAMFWKVLTNEVVTEGDVREIDSLLPKLGQGEVLLPAEINGVSGRVVQLAGCLSDSVGVERGAVIAFKKLEVLHIARQVKEGLRDVLPGRVIPIMGWEELQAEVCGATDFDIQLLQKNTVYEGFGELTPVITFFWRALWDFTPNQRSLFLKFVWGRSRLSQTDTFPVPMKIRRLVHDNPDTALPTSHTCFFSLELPAYTHFEALQERLLYAITHCNVIDTDFAAHVVDGQL